MTPQIPWHIIGPAAGAAILILITVFWFMIKWKKLDKTRPALNPNPNPPTDLGSVNKKSICFRHEKEISANQTAIDMIKDGIKTASENNREDHDKIFTKIDDMKEKIITEIHKANGDT